MPHHFNENYRLQDLLRYHVVDTPPEQEYDDLVKLAAYICQVPTALISMVDRDRQWFKAKVGLDTCETPRSVALCAHAILQPDQILMVPDATKDPRFRDNPLVVESPKIRFYAGYPLVTPRGTALGTLCVIDYQPRQLSTDQLDALAMLGRQVVSLLEMRLALQTENHLQKFKTRLITLIAHEFRTPLGIILSSAGILEDYGQKLNEDVRNKHHKRIQSSITAITRLIDEAITLDELEHGKTTPTLEWCDAQQICEDLVTVIGQTYGRKAIYLKTPAVEMSPIYTDGHILQHVMLALLTEAVQHSRHNSPIYLNLTLEADHLVLQIEDQGLGIPSPDSQHPLPPVVPDSAGNLAGTGLGIGHGQRLATLMGWQLTVHGEFGQGTTVEIQIPLTGSMPSALP